MIDKQGTIWHYPLAVAKQDICNKMAVYFDREIRPVESVAGGGLTYQRVNWHPVHELLAVSTKNETTDSDGSVHFYNEEVSQFCVIFY